MNGSDAGRSRDSDSMVGCTLPIFVRCRTCFLNSHKVCFKSNVVYTRPEVFNPAPGGPTACRV